MIEKIRKLLEDVRLELNKNRPATILAARLVGRIDDVLGHTLVPSRAFRPRPRILQDPIVTDFLDEFIEKLKSQLEADYERWGNTWLTRDKEGQEMRTEDRYSDYFDQFEYAGIPVPWLKVIGGALICWIRENHPEVCPDANECEDEGKSNVACTCSDVDATIRFLGHDGPCEGTKIVTGKDAPVEKHEPISAAFEDANLPRQDKGGTKPAPTTSKPDIKPAGQKPKDEFVQSSVDEDLVRLAARERAAVEGTTEMGFEKPVEEMTTKELVEMKPPVKHKSDCAVYNEPAFPASECNCQDCNLPDLAELMEESKEAKVGDTHVEGEHVCQNGRLAYTTSASDELLLNTITFRLETPIEKMLLIGVCDAEGIIRRPNNAQVYITGFVKPSGEYSITSMNGIPPSERDKIFVSYDYRFPLP